MIKNRALLVLAIVSVVNLEAEAGLSFSSLPPDVSVAILGAETAGTASTDPGRHADAWADILINANNLLTLYQQYGNQVQQLTQLAQSYTATLKSIDNQVRSMQSLKWDNYYDISQSINSMLETTDQIVRKAGSLKLVSGIGEDGTWTYTDLNGTIKKAAGSNIKIFKSIVDTYGYAKDMANLNAALAPPDGLNPLLPPNPDDFDKVNQYTAYFEKVKNAKNRILNKLASDEGAVNAVRGNLLVHAADNYEKLDEESKKLSILITSVAQDPDAQNSLVAQMQLSNQLMGLMAASQLRATRVAELAQMADAMEKDIKNRVEDFNKAEKKATEQYEFNGNLSVDQNEIKEKMEASKYSLSDFTGLTKMSDK